MSMQELWPKEIKVCGNLGKYEIDQILTTPADIADYVRTGLNEGRDDAKILSTEDLSDEQILDIMASHKDKMPDTSADTNAWTDYEVEMTDIYNEWLGEHKPEKAAA